MVQMQNNQVLQFNELPIGQRQGFEAVVESPLLVYMARLKDDLGEKDFYKNGGLISINEFRHEVEVMKDGHRCLVTLYGQDVKYDDIEVISNQEIKLTGTYFVELLNWEYSDGESKE